MRSDNPLVNDMRADFVDPERGREPNIPLLRKTLEHITAHPEEWDQETWATQTACGTAACVAGWAVTFNGAEIMWQDIDDDESDCQCNDCAAPHGPQAANCVVDGQVRTIHNAAAHALGLDSVQAQRMFSGRNKLPFLWEYANEISDGEIEIPTEISG